MDKRISIGIDMDSTLNNLNEAWIECYNKEYGDILTVKDVKEWEIHKFLKPECGKRIYEYLYSKDFFYNLDIQPHAKEVTEWLSQYADLYIPTAYSYQTCLDKGRWQLKHLPHIPIENLIFINNKSLLRLDYLLDDGLHNANGFNGKFVVFDNGYPYNQDAEDKFDRVYDWLDAQQYFENEFKKIGIL
jgi:5'(3')-deoxyribonucleotidase